MNTILKEFNGVVARFGECVAIKEGKKTITYNELNEESNKIANYLKEKGLQKGEFVSIYLKRSMETVISILGIIKAGGVYVPLDPTHPVERNKYIINDTKSTNVITSESLLDNITDLVAGNTNVLLMENLKTLEKVDIEFTDDAIDDLAYVIYTSGTTGNPKGTLIRQRGVINLMEYMLKDWCITNEDIIMQFATYSFDASILDTFASLYSGATLYLIDDSERMSEEGFLSVIQREGISIIPAIPTVFFNRIVNYVNERKLNTFKNVKIVGVAGELLTGDLARKFKSSIGEEIRFFNLYGPTETTAIVTCYEVPNNLDESVFSVPIGNDLPGTKLYVVNEEGNICATDEVGELWIASEGISLGYLNNKEKTDSEFIKNPFDENIHGGMLYKSGDLVKRLADGNIEFVSRKDTQVKIRGHRIEIAEIETRMNEIAEVNDAVVVVEVIDGEKTLKGFFTADVELPFHHIVENLKETLPSYMIPTKLKQIEDIPFAPTGKADRKKLEQLEADQVVMHKSDIIVAPRNEVEADILEAWKAVLGLEDIGVTDDLFDIGGHSLKIIAILSKLKVTYSTLSIKDFFELKTIENLAEKVKADSKLAVQEFKKEFTQLTEFPKMHVNEVLPTVETVLVTGATGFLGSHIANKLVEEGKRVVLVVRGDNANQRVNDTVQYFFNKEVSSQIEVVNGNLTEKYLGLKEEEFNELALSIDAIIHSAADVRHFGDREHFEKINVQGTQNIFELVEVNPKIVFHHISTVGVVEDLLAEGKWSLLEGTTEMPDGLSVESVYTDTKMIAEKWVLDKVKEGKQVFVYRMGNLVGRYCDGKFQSNIDANAFYRMLKLMILGNKAPNVLWKVDFTPIDFASEVVVKSVLKTDNPQRVYHVSHPNPITFEKLIAELNELGFDITLVERDAYNSYILSEGVSEEVKNLAVAQLDGDGANDSNAVYDSTNTMKVLELANIPALDTEYIGKLINHAISVGFIKEAVMA
ncbi:amino acid adenylation domain-containing protein [Solibacillus sp. MA9]|uniref:Amino acid adenylation domain-containing protein n=1 Tax=Solibacillus palustris TaxID=2908203 RepID=A0ABS9UI52_9BACL|nr:amino acid adenylation domain-containing protein [Solibacillus sp. MA9]MCH7323923.1 amino acid adenylation domain-containing protein [Solibacillus sp. MA9]